MELKKPAICLAAGLFALALNHFFVVAENRTYHLLPFVGCICTLLGAHGLFDPRAFELGDARWSELPRDVQMSQGVLFTIGSIFAVLLLKYFYRSSLFW